MVKGQIKLTTLWGGFYRRSKKMYSHNEVTNIQRGLFNYWARKRQERNQRQRVIEDFIRLAPRRVWSSNPAFRPRLRRLRVVATQLTLTEIFAVQTRVQELEDYIRRQLEREG